MKTCFYEYAYLFIYLFLNKKITFHLRTGADFGFVMVVLLLVNESTLNSLTTPCRNMTDRSGKIEMMAHGPYDPRISVALGNLTHLYLTCDALKVLSKGHGCTSNHFKVWP